jgi:hypothetical protein
MQEPIDDPKDQGSGRPATAQGTSNINVVNVPTVTIGNAALQPIPVKGPVVERVHANVGLPIANTLVAGFGSYAIPDGRRLTIEHLSLMCVSPQPVEMLIVAGHSGLTLAYAAAKSFPYLGGSTASIVSEPLKALVDGGSVALTVVRNADSIGTTNCSVAIEGYLTPLQ